MFPLPRIAFGVFALLAAAPALAQPAPSPNQAAIQAACKTDIQRLCAGVQPGGGQIGQCLKAHVQELSPGCKQAAAANAHQTR